MSWNVFKSSRPDQKNKLGRIKNPAFLFFFILKATLIEWFFGQPELQADKSDNITAGPLLKTVRLQH